MSKPGIRWQGAIHDIGYRHYDGPRLGRGYIRKSLFAESLRGSYGFGRSTRSKVMPILLLAGICLPALIISIVTSAFGADRLPITYTSYPFRVQVVIAIFVAAQAPAIMSRDLRYRVISLYFSRPLDRADYVLAKYAAMVSALFVLIALPLTILFLGALLAKLPVRDNLPDYLRAMAAAVLYALVIAGIGLLVAAMTPRRGLGVAAVISVLLILSGVQLAVVGHRHRVRQHPARRLLRAAVAVFPGGRRGDQSLRSRVLASGRSARHDGHGGLHRRVPASGRRLLRRPAHSLPKGGGSMSTLNLEQVSRWFGNVVAVNDVTMRIGPGVTGLLGPNGAGKSTLIHMMAGFLAPSTGAVTLNGDRVWRNESIYRTLGLVPEREDMYDSLSGWEFVLANAKLHRLPNPEAAARRALETVQMTSVQDRAVRTYSKGMKQRIKMATAIVHDPEVLLLDEPFNGMDPRQRLQLMELLHTMGDSGRTVLFSSHILEEVEQIAGRIEVMVAGRHAASGDFREIRRLMTQRPHQYTVRSSDDRGVGVRVDR